MILSYGVMIPSLSFTKKPGNYTKVALGSNENKSSSAVISFLKDVTG